MPKMSQVVGVHVCIISIPNGKSVPKTYVLWVYLFNPVIQLGINMNFRIVILCTSPKMPHCQGSFCWFVWVLYLHIICACIFGKFCLFWLTNKIFEFEFEYYSNSESPIRNRFHALKLPAREIDPQTEKKSRKYLFAEIPLWTCFNWFNKMPLSQ